MRKGMTWPNPAHALDGGIPSESYIGCSWPAASDVHRWPEEGTMNILPACNHRFRMSKRGWLSGALLVVSLVSLGSGCVSMSEQAESDMRWKQDNPNWMPIGPEQDPRAQWGEDLSGWPRNRQFP